MIGINYHDMGEPRQQMVDSRSVDDPAFESLLRMGERTEQSVGVIVGGGAISFHRVRGTEVPDSHEWLPGLTIPLDDVEQLQRESGHLHSTVTIRTMGNEYPLERIQRGVAFELCDSIVGNTGLTEPTRDARYAAGLLSGVGLGVSLFIGGFGILVAMAGMLFSFTLVGAVIGIPMAIVGAALASAALGGGSLSLTTTEHTEWTRESSSSP